MGINKKGIWKQSKEFSELPSPIWVEPDGSEWLQILHHANPTTYKFASTDDFTKDNYKNENVWSRFDLLNKTFYTFYEILVIQKKDSSSEEQKWRWTQRTNPMVATYSDVATITRVTTEGYSTSTYKGVYHKGTSTYLCCNNGTEGNWWGAFGAWSGHEGGIPGYDQQVVKDGGYINVYIRFRITDDGLFNDEVKIYNNNGNIGSREFIEV